MESDNEDDCEWWRIDTSEQTDTVPQLFNLLPSLFSQRTVNVNVGTKTFRLSKDLIEISALLSLIYRNAPYFLEKSGISLSFVKEQHFYILIPFLKLAAAKRAAVPDGLISMINRLTFESLIELILAGDYLQIPLVVDVAIGVLSGLANNANPSQHVLLQNRLPEFILKKVIHSFPPNILELYPSDLSINTLRAYLAKNLRPIECFAFCDSNDAESILSRFRKNTTYLFKGPIPREARLPVLMGRYYDFQQAKSILETNKCSLHLVVATSVDDSKRMFTKPAQKVVQASCLLPEYQFRVCSRQSSTPILKTIAQPTRNFKDMVTWYCQSPNALGHYSMMEWPIKDWR